MQLGASLAIFITAVIAGSGCEGEENACCKNYREGCTGDECKDYCIGDDCDFYGTENGELRKEIIPHPTWKNSTMTFDTDPETGDLMLPKDYKGTCIGDELYVDTMDDGMYLTDPRK